ncbi:hypothetical protein J6V86_01105 [bacterium]|nr:hypothetical protein [bacterium]
MAFNYLFLIVLDRNIILKKKGGKIMARKCNLDKKIRTALLRRENKLKRKAYRKQKEEAEQRAKENKEKKMKEKSLES